MRAQKVGIREFRENLSSFLESASPVAITRHGETVGYYIPTRRKPKDADIAALESAAAQLQALISRAGATEEELVAEFKEMRRRGKRTSG